MKSKSNSFTQIYVRSTDVNRTLLSAMSNMAGMYANGMADTDYPGNSQWPTNWTPIPIHTVENENDHVRSFEILNVKNLLYYLNFISDS